MTDPITVGIIVSAAAYVAKQPAAQDFLMKIAGPLATELGEAVADPIREWRARRAAATVVRSMEQLESAGITPTPVSPKLLVPIAESSSLEDDDALTERWAALLANAAAGASGAPVRPRFIALLQQLTAAEAAVLTQLGASEYMALAAIKDASGWTSNNVSSLDLSISVDTLISLGLAEREGAIRQEGGDWRLISSTEERLRITVLGRTFLAAVTPPEQARAGPEA